MMKRTLVAALALSSFVASMLPAQTIEISAAEDRTSVRGPESAYTGVGIAEFLFRANDASPLTAAEISFEPGARTAWHNHPAGQYLIVTAGVGWVQARGEVKRVVRAGDVVWTPPGVFHWHGATATQGMRHLAVWEFVDGSGGELGEHVSDEEYLAAIGEDGAPAITAAPSPLPPTDDYSAFGPFETVSEANTGPDGTYTIVRPATLGENGFLHAPITFGPGIGSQVQSLMGLLERIASHGFVIIGRQLNGPPGDAENNRRMIAGLDWLLAQNTTAGSAFEGKLLVERAASMGYSVGGTAAVDIGGHEAITTVVSIHGHNADGELHGTLLLLGGTNDVMRDGRSWLAPTYEAAEVPTLFSLVEGANHGYITRAVDGVQGGVETPAMIAWLRYWIYDDQAAKSYFFGDDCRMCSSPWTNTQRKNWSDDAGAE